MKVLLVEDDDSLRGMLAKALRRLQYVVEEAATLAEGMLLSRSARFDVLLVDWNLPDGPGTALIKAHRQSGGSSSAIIITSRDSVEDQVAGLAAGADDYIIKPFHLLAFTAKVQAMSRRAEGWLPPVFTIEDLTIDAVEGTASVDGRKVSLTPTERKVLLFLAHHRRRPAPQSEIAAGIGWSENTAGLHSLEVHISSIRHKLAASGSVVTIVARRDSGYQLVVERNRAASR